jgi:2',3'-cyclic-nucleotide 2'-phosphodiesterase (5'-nucleotidase family)
LPRVATLVKRLRRVFPRSIFCVAGDFLAPSCMSKHFKGDHMVQVLNEMGVNYVTFGNHEFEDIFTPAQLTALIKKSNFKWISVNFEASDSELRKAYLQCDAMRMSERVHLLLTGFLYEKQYKKFGIVYDPKASAEALIECWEESVAEEYDGKGSAPVTFYAAMTHQRMTDDIAFADAFPQFRLLSETGCIARNSGEPM